MKIALFCSGAPNQIALANKLHEAFGLDGIILRVPMIRAQTLRKRIRGILRGLETRIASAPFARAWHAMGVYYSQNYPEFSMPITLKVPDINDRAVFDFIEDEKPDLVLVSGTNLLKGDLIAAINADGRAMNLHTGISPYLKGGPNCTNWCIYLGRFDLIGNTIMWIDAGIDTGVLLATEQTPLQGNETAQELHVKVMEHAHDLYVRAVRRFVNSLSLPAVSQSDIATGRTFYTRQWRAPQMLKAWWNFKFARRDIPFEKLRLVTMDKAS